MKPVGSKAVREAILKYEPVLSVHGHIHESKGVKKLGRTLAMNPGSSYTDGVLQGAILDLNEKKGKVARYILVNG
jgi:Icc-related predicted phosphoesterase